VARRGVGRVGRCANNAQRATLGLGGKIFDLLDAHAQTSYLVLRVLPLGNEFGENAVNPRLAISPATSSWSLPISSGDGELA
jgi:hypothetical protein